MEEAVPYIVGDVRGYRQHVGVARRDDEGHAGRHQDAAEERRQEVDRELEDDRVGAVDVREQVDARRRQRDDERADDYFGYDEAEAGLLRRLDVLRRAHALNHILVAEDEEEYREDVAERLHEIQAADERIAPLGKVREDAEKSAVDLPRENRYRDEEAADEEERAYRVRVGDADHAARHREYQHDEARDDDRRVEVDAGRQVDEAARGRELRREDADVAEDYADRRDDARRRSVANLKKLGNRVGRRLAHAARDEIEQQHPYRRAHENQNSEERAVAPNQVRRPRDSARAAPRREKRADEDDSRKAAVRDGEVVGILDLLLRQVEADAEDAYEVKDHTADDERACVHKNSSL